MKSPLLSTKILVRVVSVVVETRHIPVKPGFGLLWRRKVSPGRPESHIISSSTDSPPNFIWRELRAGRAKHPSFHVQSADAEQCQGFDMEERNGRKIEVLVDREFHEAARSVLRLGLGIVTVANDPASDSGQIPTVADADADAGDNADGSLARVLHRIRK
nr:hypothetical protein CFP56_00560 [Quercus suber]